MPHEFDYEAAKAIFHDSDLHEVRADGVWLLKGNIAPLLTRTERNAFIAHPLYSLWEMGKPSPSSQPVLRIPFTAADLAACFAVGAGALHASGCFGDSDEDLDESLGALDDDPVAKDAVRAAYAEFIEAVEVVGALDVRHEEDAQRKTEESREALRLVRKRLNIDDDLARVNAELEAELSAQQSKLEEKLAPLKAGLEAQDEESIKQKTALRDDAELQEAKSREAAVKKREKIFAVLDEWKAKDVDYRNLRDAVADAKKAAAEAEATWRKKMVQHLLNQHQAMQAEQQGAESVGRTALPSDPKEKREALLDMFRTLGGKRPKEDGDKGTRGALAKLQRETGIDDKNLGVMLDKAIDEKAAANMWGQLAAK